MDQTLNGRPARKWRRRIGLLLLTLLIVAGALVVVLAPRGPTLLQRATRIARTKGLHCWLSDHKVLFLPGGNYHYRISIMDLATKTWLREKRMDAVFNAFCTDRYFYSSPDGKWLLCSAFESAPAHAVRLADGHTLAFPMEESYILYTWIPGTSRWMYLTAEVDTDSDALHLKKVTIFDVTGPRPVQVLKAAPGIAIDEYAIPVALRDGRLLIPSAVEDSKDGMAAAIRTVECAVEGGRVTLKRTFMLRLPSPKEVYYFALSPQGDRIAWVEEYDLPAPAWRRWLGKWLRRFAASPQRRNVLCVARLDGTGRREIGDTLKQPGRDKFVTGVQWTPDGRRVSFLCDGALWTVPVEEP
jgi:hypothetical protein